MTARPLPQSQQQCTGTLSLPAWVLASASLRKLGKPRFPNFRNLAAGCGVWAALRERRSSSRGPSDILAAAWGRSWGGAGWCHGLTWEVVVRRCLSLGFLAPPFKVKGKTSGLCPEPCQGASPPGPRSGFNLWRCLSPTPPLGTSPAAWVSAPPVRSPPAGQYSWGAFPGRAPGPLPSSRSTGGLYQTGTSSSAHPPNPE